MEREKQMDGVYTGDIRSAVACEIADGKRKTRGRKIAVAVAICAFILAVGCVADFCGAPFLRYCSGIAKLERERYAAAQTVFADLGDYLNAQDLMREAEKGLRYLEAEEHLAQGQYAQALEIYEELGKFRDAAKKIRQVRYGYAVQLLEQGEKDAAKELLLQAGNYLDTLALIEEINLAIGYDSAMRSMEKKDYSSAADGFAALGEYRDAREREAECRALHELVSAYNQGKLHYQCGEWLEAYRALAPIRDEDYLDTVEILDTIMNGASTYVQTYAERGERGKVLAFLQIVEEYDAAKGSALREELIGEEVFAADQSFYYFDTTHIERFTANTPTEEFASVVLYMLIHGKMEYPLMSNKAVDYDILLDRSFQGCDLAGEMLPGYGSIYNPSVSVGENYVVFYLDHEQEYNEFQRTQHLKTFKSFCEDSVRQLTEMGLLGESMTSRQKAEVIINWVGYYLTYDHSLTIHDVGVAVENRRGVCEAYAALYNRMCNLAGIPTYGQVGDAGSGQDNARHIWSFHVDEDGNIFYADATWADPWDIDFGAPGEEAPTVEMFAEAYLERCLRQALAEQKQVGGYSGSSDGRGIYVYSVKRWMSHVAERDAEQIIAYHAKITGKAA